MVMLSILFWIIVIIAAFIIHLGAALIVKSFFNDYDWWKKSYNIILLVPPVSWILFSVSALVIIGVFAIASIKDILD